MTESDNVGWYVAAAIELAGTLTFTKRTQKNGYEQFTCKVEVRCPTEQLARNLVSWTGCGEAVEQKVGEATYWRWVLRGRDIGEATLLALPHLSFRTLTLLTPMIEFGEIVDGRRQFSEGERVRKNELLLSFVERRDPPHENG